MHMATKICFQLKDRPTGPDLRKKFTFVLDGIVGKLFSIRSSCTLAKSVDSNEDDEDQCQYLGHHEHVLEPRRDLHAVAVQPGQESDEGGRQEAHGRRGWVTLAKDRLDEVLGNRQ